MAVPDKAGGYRLLTGNEIGVLLLEHILRKKSEAGRLPAKGFAVKSVVSTGLAQPICDKYGVRLEQVPVGFKYTGEKIGLLEDGGDETFLFGFEESSGFLGGSYTRDKDAVYGAMQFAELALDCKNQGITVLDRLDALYAEFGYYTEKTFGLSLDPAEGAARLKQAMEEGKIAYAGKYSAPDYEQILAAGCRLAIENTMILHTPEVKEQGQRTPGAEAPKATVL